MRRACSAAGLVLAVLAAGNAAAGRDQRLLPLDPGNRWTLRDLSFDSERKMLVIRDARGLMLRGLPGAADLRVRSRAGNLQAWDAQDGRWETILRLEAPAGTKYVADLEGTPLWQAVQVTVASKRAVARGLAGRIYRDCTRLTFRYGKGLADAGLTELVFAPGVGLVRFTVLTIAGPRTSVLASFKRGSS